MALMDRIIFRDFLQQTHEERLDLITKVQSLRTNSLDEARTKKGRVTKSAKKNLTKRGKKVKDPTAELTKTLKGLTKSQIAKLVGAYGL